MEEELRRNVEELTRAFAEATSLRVSTVLDRATKDARFLDRVGSGKSFTVRLYDRAITWFSDNWPDGAVWPPTIARPRQKSEAAA